MEFINLPQQCNPIRADHCKWLRCDNGECVTLKVSQLTHSNYRLMVKLTMKTHPNQRHFIKLVRVDKKRNDVRENSNGEIEYNIRPNEMEIKLDFFGIKKSKKDEARNFIQAENFQFHDIDAILKQNSSTAMLNIYLFDDRGQMVDHLVHELHFEKLQPIEIMACAPRTLYDSDEITYVLKHKIKNDEDKVQLRLMVGDSEYVTVFKPLLQPAKNVVIFSLKLHKLLHGTFKCQLFNDATSGEWLDFFIRKNEPDLKRKKSSPEEDSLECQSHVKIPRPQTISECESGPVDIYITKKDMITENIHTKVLREIARVGHDFAFGKQITERMVNIMKKIPVVCILQDDVKDTPLNNAILQDKEERADHLLDIVNTYFPEAVNYVNSSGHTALILCPACNISYTFVRKLIYSGANIMAKDEDGNTALNIAIDYRKSEIFDLLVHEATSRHLLLDTNEDVISLLKEILNKEYMEGFAILAKYFPELLVVDSVMDHLNENQKKIYLNYVNYMLEVENILNISDDQLNNLNIELFTPIAESSPSSFHVNPDHDFNVCLS